jgi:hypothetical protein
MCNIYYNKIFIFFFQTSAVPFSTGIYSFIFFHHLILLIFNYILEQSKINSIISSKGVNNNNISSKDHEK